MIRVLAQQLLRLPEAAQQGGGKLPWSNGSLLSGKLQPGPTPGTAMLQLGAYRLQAQVPAQVRMGQVWLQLVDQTMPAKFRLLSDRQAEEVMLGMLGKQSAASHAQAMRPQEPLQHPMQQQLQQLMDQQQLPFRAYTQHDPGRLLVCDHDEHTPRGTVRQDMRQGAPMLSGRMDLDHLGAVAFTLDIRSEAWGLNLFVEHGEMMDSLRPPFIDWLQQQRPSGDLPPLSAQLQAGLPSESEEAYR